MNQFDLVQYGYLGLLAFIIFAGSQLIKMYIQSSNPPKYSIYLISVFFILLVVGGIFGFLWADKELKSSEAKKSTATILENQIAKARERLDNRTKELLNARDISLENIVNNALLDSTQGKHKQRLQEINKMIEMQEVRYENELANIIKVFKSSNIKEVENISE